MWPACTSASWTALHTWLESPPTTTHLPTRDGSDAACPEQGLITANFLSTVTPTGRVYTLADGRNGAGATSDPDSRLGVFGRSDRQETERRWIGRDGFDTLSHRAHRGSSS